MTRFRPCIDLHDGQVKQIVGSSLNDHAGDESVRENFVSPNSAAWFAKKYAADRLSGGHVIKLGTGNDTAALSALNAYPGGLQLGGGINLDNAGEWLDSGASQVIVTSWLFDSRGRFQPDRLKQLVSKIGADRIVIDLSCKRRNDGWVVAMNRWQTLTDLNVESVTLNRLADHCSEFLIHAADVEGLCRGIDHELVVMLGSWGKIPITYAGGIANMDDVELVDSLSGGKLDLTVGSALDLFGGTGVKYEALVARNRKVSG